MKKNIKFTKRKELLVLALLALCAVVFLQTIVFIIMAHSKREQANQTGSMLIDQVRSVLRNNEKKENSLVESLKENYISKAKAVSYIIDNIPATETDISEQLRIAKLMSIDEIHIFDQDGKIYAGTVPAYYGYSFSSGEQMAFFKPMLRNRALSMCQDVTPNTAEGKSMMYAICWSVTGKRMVQIGIEPRRLLEEMRTNEIVDVVSGMPSYDGVDILIADRETGEILGSTKRDQTGVTLEEIGVTLKNVGLYETAHFRSKINGKNVFCSVCPIPSYVIAVLQDRSAVYQDIPLVMLMVFLYLMLAVAAIILIVRKMTDYIMAERYQANTDAMTGFYNRRAYEEEIKKQGAAEPELVYISVDLNGLKTTNDTLGHDAGDRLICAAAECMKHSFGSCGKLYRIGGDEFVALIRCDGQRLETLRAEYEQSLTSWTEKNGLTLSTACGYVRAAEFPDKSMTELAKIADERMYEEKSKYYQANGIDRRRSR
ncbi:MAG: GGDEF domain-containing protein [Oscillospiraceae bacterium]|nr:GGDEF domain-containing protein [Oscillospiraceae bacterium]